MLLRRGEPILKPIYDHRTGTFAAPVYVEPREFVIAEGLHGLSSPALRRAFDVRIYLDPPEDLRRRWKIKRDTAKRGYTPEQVIAELAKREADSRDYIRPQRQHADMVIRFQPPQQIEAVDLADDSHLDAHLVLRASLPHPDLSAVVASGPRESGSMRLTMGRDDGQLSEFLEIAGNARDEDVIDLERHIQDQLGRIGVPDPASIGVVPDGPATHHSHPLALAQLLVAYHLLRMRHTPAETSIEEQRRSADGVGASWVDDTALVLE
jgi:phosphoribulokinase